MGVDVINPSGAPPFMVLGYAKEQALIRRWEEQYNTRMFTSGTSNIDAMRALKVKRILGTTYFRGDINKIYGQYFVDAGFECLDMAGIDVDFHKVPELPSSTVYDFIKDAFSRNPSAEAVYMLGPAWPTLDIVERLEQDLGVPVFHAVPVQCWDIQRHLGIREPVQRIRAPDRRNAGRRDNGGAARYVLSAGGTRCRLLGPSPSQQRLVAAPDAARRGEHAVLPGQADHHRGRLHRRRHLRCDRAAVRAPSRQAPRRQSERDRAQHAGLRQPGRDAAPLQRRAQGRHHARRGRRRRRARAAARQPAGEIRRAPLQLDRRAHQGQHRLRHLEQGAGADHGRRRQARDRRRRHRAGLAHAHPSARVQRTARHQIQGRHPAIPAATRSRWRSNAARSKAIAAGPSAAS